jgi:hypothetical protein
MSAREFKKAAGANSSEIQRFDRRRGQIFQRLGELEGAVFHPGVIVKPSQSEVVKGAHP